MSIVDRMPAKIATGFMESKKTDTKKISVSLEPDTFEEVMVFARRGNFTASSAIRQLTKEGLKANGLR